MLLPSARLKAASIRSRSNLAACQFGSCPRFRCETLPAARRFCDRSKLFLLAASLGGVESLIVLPIYTSHHRMNQAELSAAGVKPGTVRMSVGLEAPRDLRADLLQALA